MGAVGRERHNRLPNIEMNANSVSRDSSVHITLGSRASAEAAPRTGRWFHDRSAPHPGKYEARHENQG